MSLGAGNTLGIGVTQETQGSGSGSQGPAGPQDNITRLLQIDESDLTEITPSQIADKINDNELIISEIENILIEVIENNVSQETGNNEEISIVVELGQSNMEGRDGDNSNPAYPFTSTNGYYFDGTSQFPIATNRGGAVGGSQSNYFCEEYYSLTNKKAVILELSKGGSAMSVVSDSGNGNWSDTGNLRPFVEERINKALNYYSKTEPNYALWCLGERDAQELDNNPSYTKTLAKTALQNIINWWFSLYPNTPFIISLIGDIAPYNNTQGWNDVRAIQTEIAAENANVYIGFSNAINFGSQGKMKSDGLHYNYLGLKEMGEALANFIKSNNI